MLASTLPEVIDGWFAVAFAKDVPVGGIKPIRLMGEDLVVVRTASGAVAVYEAFCPHLGASFAAQGRVEGEHLRCGAHGFCFDAHGTCVSSGYQARPEKGRARTSPAVEWLGVIMVWRHRDGASPWALPEVTLTGRGAPTHDVFRLRGHPQEVIENGVDTGHFIWIHGFTDGERTTHLTREGHHLQLGSSFNAPASATGQGNRAVRIQFDFQAFGLGIAVIGSDSDEIGLKTVTVVMPTLIGDGELEIRFVTLLTDPAALARSVPVVGPLIPGALGGPVVRELFRRAAVFDFQKDIVYWGTKRYLPNPAVIQGDGPIVAYRRWAQQFYGVERAGVIGREAEGLEIAVAK